MRYKTVVWDIMQLMFKNFNDHQLHSIISFDSHIDEECLKKAVGISINAFPIIGCRFATKSAFTSPYWEKCNFTSCDIVEIVETSNAEKILDKLIVTRTDETSGPQIKIYLVRSSKKDDLCIIFNHMVSDAAGFREYIYMLSTIYSGLKNNTNYVCRYNMGSRSTKQIFKKFSFCNKMKILRSSSEVSKYNTGVYFNLQGDNSNPFIVKCKIPKEDFLSMKDYSKKNNVTINDMLLASYIRSLHTSLKIKHIVLPCPVDLRKYLPQKKSEGISNFVSNMVCDVECEDNDTYLDTLLKVKRCMDREKDSFSCLKGPLMLDILFDTLPYKTFKKTIMKSFSNPPIAMTNIGIIDKNELVFEGLKVTDAFISGSIKYKPYFQVAVTTFDDEVTLTVNFYGTEQDRKKIEDFLELLRDNCRLKDKQ